MEFSRQAYRSGLPFPTPGDLPDPQTKAISFESSALHADSLPLSHQVPEAFIPIRVMQIYPECHYLSTLAVITVYTYAHTYVLI